LALRAEIVCFAAERKDRRAKSEEKVVKLNPVRKEFSNRVKGKSEKLNRIWMQESSRQNGR
jgi:hypothetical protein